MSLFAEFENLFAIPSSKEVLIRRKQGLKGLDNTYLNVYH